MRHQNELQNNNIGNISPRTSRKKTSKIFIAPGKVPVAVCVKTESESYVHIVTEFEMIPLV
jgi:hypothetical protein